MAIGSSRLRARVTKPLVRDKERLHPLRDHGGAGNDAGARPLGSPDARAERRTGWKTSCGVRSAMTALRC